MGQTGTHSCPRTLPGTAAGKAAFRSQKPTASAPGYEPLVSAQSWCGTRRAGATRTPGGTVSPLSSPYLSSPPPLGFALPLASAPPFPLHHPHHDLHTVGSAGS